MSGGTFLFPHSWEKHFYSIPRKQQYWYEQVAPPPPLFPPPFTRRRSDFAGWCKFSIQRCHCTGGTGLRVPIFDFSPKPVTLKIPRVYESRGELMKTDSDSVDLRWGLTIYTSNKLPGDAWSLLLVPGQQGHGLSTSGVRKLFP